jgi:ADP-ribose pyrophosphatase YjhB (NUDIX family)
MKPAPVTDFLLHDLVMSAAAEGAVRTAVAAAVTLDERILLCGQDTGDFQREWGLPGGMPLPGETLTDALSRILACGYGLDVTESGTYLGSHDSIHGGEVTRTFVFTATCADPAQICQHARIAHRWADPADLPEQAGQDLARLADIAMLTATAPSASPPGPCQVTAALRAWSKGIYCDEAATELLIRHRTWLRRDDFTTRFIITQAGPTGNITAAVSWEEAITALQAGTLPCSGSEASILHLAASLAGTTPVDLRDLITGLDRANIQLVLNAIRHAGGRN